VENLSYEIVLLVFEGRHLINESLAQWIFNKGKIIGLSNYYSKIRDDQNQVITKTRITHNVHFVSYHYKENHIVIRFQCDSSKDINLAKFINAFKSATSRLMKRKFPEVFKGLREINFWHRGYCLYTVGEVDQEEVYTEYIHKMLSRYHNDKV
jgi:REP element-mobilizing transposase RayT